MQHYNQEISISQMTNEDRSTLELIKGLSDGFY